ncbi:N-acetylmuramoyl-L-alanine amidase [Prosthecobacter debontii]|uniref:N-acetylmuramoyl-L-alanine amidase n=1 Tax=Prosthecobacter debontii TaxID=48467 RepID=A0A1T4XQ44_9BACT|nr:N-acetylmuramoyl-L-alanine amidase [Prosthecobacter debontii]SKA91660.1 N-acetylmuramoyl-L-alanine amidase [Prosthecobacter debontii]
MTRKAARVYHSLPMNKGSALLVLPLALLTAVIFAACSSSAGRSKISMWEARYNDRALGRVTPDQLLREVGIKTDLIPPGKVGRYKYRPMTPRYITIHSTQNYSGDAYNHALALKRGALRATKRPGGNRIGFLTWHFTVQSNVAIQHLPCREQGEHADFDGPGNNYSIGIEMCEHRGNDIALTIDKTARLAAYLMYTYGIPLDHVVPHYHWPRISPYIKDPHKDCPHFLLDRGRPGPTWQWFLRRVNLHYSRLIPGPARTLG